MRKKYAIANYRVSSDEQLQNNSLNRQQITVENFVNETLQTDIVQVWSGSVSSKAGSNIFRKDLRARLDYCKTHREVGFAVFDEVDRFMRSMLELGYFLVEFNNLGVQVHFASQPYLRAGTANETLMLMLEAFKAQGSNEERQRKSISGQTQALKDGRWTFIPKPGYMKGTVSGMPQVHPERGPALQRVLKRLASGLITPTAALKELNDSDFTNNHSAYKMDEKFIKIVTDPFYAGILEINKQVQIRNENGLHQPLITREEHFRLLEIMAKKPKYQMGPRKNGNPEFPMSNLLVDDQCLHAKNGGRAAGFNHSNGKNVERIYKKYRCRSCNRYWYKDTIDQQVITLFEKYEMTDDLRKDVLKALDTIWKQNEDKTQEDISRIKKSIQDIRLSISQQVESATDPSNARIKDEILALIDEKKEQLQKYKAQLYKLQNAQVDDYREFMEFALGFVEDTGRHFLEEYVSRENRSRCKQLIFPGGILINQKNIVYTPEVTIFYRLAAKKKDAEASEISQMVRVTGL